MNTPKTLVAGALALAFAVTGCSHLPSTTDTTPATGVKEMAEAPLTIQTYNPGEEAIFAVSSTLVQGRKEAILIDAQFSAEDARKLAAQIKASGKRLVAIYISHSDPDFYFGLDTLKGEFPEARIVATPQTVAAIEQNKDIKLKVWGPQLGENAPKNIIIPEPLDGDIPVVAGEHVWMADTQTPQSHADWLTTLDRIQALNPSVVIPGHYAPGSALDMRAVQFTGDYIRAFDEEAAKATNSAELISAMKARYPHLVGEGSLDLSAKVAMGEMQWP